MTPFPVAEFGSLPPTRGEGVARPVSQVLEANPVIGDVRVGPRRFWTGREDKILSRHYPVGGLSACLAELPGRTAKAIYQRARLNGLDAPTTPPKPRPEPYTINDHIDAAITRVYQRAPVKGDIQRLALTLNRPRWWVSKRAAELGLVVPRFRALPWTDVEIAIITRLATRSPAYIRKALKAAGHERTETAIKVQLKRLHVSTVADDPDVYNSRSLAELMGIDSHAVTAWIAKGWLRAKQTGDARTAMWKIRRKDVRAFVVENAAAVDIRRVDRFWFIDLLAGGA